MSQIFSASLNSGSLLTNVEKTHLQIRDKLLQICHIFPHDNLTDFSISDMDRQFTTKIFTDFDETHVRRERNKARDLRNSQWWKRRCAKGVCHYCNCPSPPGELTMDHIVPISRGGRSTKGNIVPCCKICNSKKKQLLPMEWEEYVNAAHSES